MSAVSDKAIKLVVSCKTIEQLNCADRYIVLAKKSGAINRSLYLILLGMIMANIRNLQINGNLKRVKK